jgi:hypothetical protein
VAVSPAVRLRPYFWMFMLVAIDVLVLVGCGKSKY